MKKKPLIFTLICLLVGLSLPLTAYSYQLLSVQKDTSFQKGVTRGTASSLKINQTKSQAYLEFPLPLGSVDDFTKINLVLKTRGVHGAKNLKASEVMATWSESSLAVPQEVGAKSAPISLPKKGTLKLDVTDVVKAQIVAGRSNINLAVSTERGGLQVMSRESGLGAELEIISPLGGDTIYNITTNNNSTNIISNVLPNFTSNIVDLGDTIDILSNLQVESNMTVKGVLDLGGFVISQLFKTNISITPPPILGGLLWSTNITGITQPGDVLLGVSGLDLNNSLLPNVSINDAGEIQVGLKNLDLLGILNLPQQDLTLTILR